jgi:hypothetical protein
MQRVLKNRRKKKTKTVTRGCQTFARDLSEKTENSGHSKNSNYRINRGPHSNVLTTKTSNHLNLFIYFSDGRFNFSGHHTPTATDNADNHRTCHPTS